MDLCVPRKLNAYFRHDHTFEAHNNGTYMRDVVLYEGCIQFDNALLMEQISHEWHDLGDISGAEM